MSELKSFNEKYSSQKAKQLRDEIADITFNIQYFQIRIQHLSDELTAKHAEYLSLLGLPENFGVCQNGENEKK